MNNKFLIVVVIFECDFDDSITLQRLSLRRQKVWCFPDILIYDNSPRSRFSEKYLQTIAFYKHDPANNGVAGAYNYALEVGKNEQKEWLMLFDQDTNISDTYFDEMEKCLEIYPQQTLFCPIVRSGNSIVSPTYYVAEKPIKPRRLKPGLLKTKFYTIINSGITIQLRELDSLGGYDSDLPLDLSDHNFFRKYKKKHEKFVLIDAVNLHDLSSESDITFDAVYSRFKKYYNSVQTYSDKIHSVFPLLWLWVRVVKLTLKFTRFDFLKFILFKK